MASYAMLYASGRGTHLNVVTCAIVCRLKAPKNCGTLLGLMSLARAHASVGAFGHGVPVRSQSRMSGRIILASDLYFLVPWLRNIDASSTMTRLKSGSLRTRSVIHEIATPSWLRM